MKYTITKIGPVGGDSYTTVYRVEWAISTFPGKDHTDVWVTNGKPRCVQCSGPLRAMLSTCRHAQAVKRFLARSHSVGS